MKAAELRLPGNGLSSKTKHSKQSVLSNELLKRRTNNASRMAGAGESKES